MKTLPYAYALINDFSETPKFQFGTNDDDEAYDGDSGGGDDYDYTD